MKINLLADEIPVGTFAIGDIRYPDSQFEAVLTAWLTGAPLPQSEATP